MFKEYMKYILQYQEAQLFLTAVELGIFSVLEKPVFPDAVAEKKGLNARNTSFFLNALGAVGIIRKENGLYRNTKEGQRFLNENSPDYMGDYILFRQSLSALEDLEILLTQGAGENRDYDPSRVFNFQKMAQMSRKEIRLGREQILAETVEYLYEKNMPLRILDLGGGPGTLSLQILKDYPLAETVVFEQKPVAAYARVCAEEEGINDKLTVVEGDFNLDPIEGHYELVIASGIMDFAQNHLSSLMAKIDGALVPGGYFYMVTHGVSRDYQSPKASILGWLKGQLNGGDVLTCEDVILSAVRKRGFVKRDLPQLTDGNQWNAHLFRKLNNSEKDASLQE